MDKAFLASLVSGAAAAAVTSIVTAFYTGKRLNIDKWLGENKEAREIRDELRNLITDARSERDKARAERDKAYEDRDKARDECDEIRAECDKHESEVVRLRRKLLKYEAADTSVETQ